MTPRTPPKAPKPGITAERTEYAEKDLGSSVDPFGVVRVFRGSWANQQPRITRMPTDWCPCSSVPISVYRWFNSSVSFFPKGTP
jgi:hypothetical protein